MIVQITNLHYPLFLQGLTERLAAQEASDAAHPALRGFNSTSVLLPDHPSSKRVTMRVKVRDCVHSILEAYLFFRSSAGG